MRADERILARLQKLIEDGKAVLATKREPSPGHITSSFVDVQLATKWLVSSLNLLDAVFGADSAHHARLKPHATDYPKWPDAQQAMGVLLAAKDDIEAGALFSVRSLVEAELFDDFLEQAEELQAKGYYQPAAVVAGCVLEDGLRKLCQRATLPLPPKPTLDSMNSALAKNGNYSKLTQKKITALADIRNNAAHGHWKAFDSTEVDVMIRDVRDFMDRHFS
jgi:hypothetical protein